MNHKPGFVYNCDETGLSSVPNTTKRVLAEKGERAVQNVTCGERGFLTTIIPCCNVLGDFIPPFVIFKGSSIPDVSDFPKNSKLIFSKSGYVDSELFLLFLNHFDQFRTKVDGQKSFLFVDGHSSHLFLEVVDFCLDKNIELICIPPHTSHRLQPMDTHFNKRLKQLWCENLRSFLCSHDQIILTKWDFGKIFSQSWTDTVGGSKGKMLEAFDHCGLFPPHCPVKDNEYAKSKNYSATIQPRANASFDHESVALRELVPSPKKIRNPSHHKPHQPHVTSSEFVKARKRKTGLLSDQSTSQAAPVNDTIVSTIDRHRVCIVCGAQWGISHEDWFKCVKCSKWACENCFGTNKCSNCLNV